MNSLYTCSLMLTVLLICFLTGCGGQAAKQPLTPPDSDVPWSYAQDGVVLQLSAVSNLNEHEGEASSLMLCVYQLSARQGFDMRLLEQAGFTELLACKRFDDSVVTAQRLFSDPQQEQTLFLDRQEQVRWLAVLAGYYHGTPAHSALIVPVPVRTVTEGWVPFMKKKHREPEQTVLSLRLGQYEILKK